jgi:MYXO-CTERM domain-containing protein
MKNRHNNPSLIVAGAAALSSSFWSLPAEACGGFFCSRSAPVFQAAERIIFAQEGDQVTQIVEVMYEGPSEKFSWVLPVPGIPVPGVSSKEVFNLLDGATAPRFTLQGDGNCQYDEGSILSGGDGDADPSSPPSVTVLDAGSVGPFDYETISITAEDDPAAVAVEWLTNNGYDVTPETGELLGPYLANGLNLIAFRLQKGQSSGAIRPISLEYEAPKMAIPIKPTSVAANDDMPVIVWVLGKDRAVPTNYRGLEINELLIDWFNPSSSYGEVVTAAANEAGGQGFVTELVADASTYADIVRPAASDIDSVFESGGSFENTIQSIVRQLGSWDGFLESAAAHIQLRDGITIDEFVGCSYCYFSPEDYSVDEQTQLGFGGAASIEEGISPDDPIYATDLAALEQSLRDTVIKPLMDAGALLEKHSKVTRLYTTMSAEEMTKDPTFEFNPDLGDVSNDHTAIQEMEDPDSCGEGKWTITLSDGTKVYGEDREWPHRLGDTELTANARILQFSTSGGPVVIGDMTQDNTTKHEDSDAGVSPGANSSAGCAISPTPGPVSIAWLAGLALFAGFVARRRVRTREATACNPREPRSRAD